MRAYWGKCCVETCGREVCSSRELSHWHNVKCSKHVRDEQIEEAVDRTWESNHSNKRDTE